MLRDVPGEVAGVDAAHLHVARQEERHGADGGARGNLAALAPGLPRPAGACRPRDGHPRFLLRKDCRPALRAMRAVYVV